MVQATEDTSILYSVDDGYATYALGRDLEKAKEFRDKTYPGLPIRKSTVTYKVEIVEESPDGSFE